MFKKINKYMKHKIDRRQKILTRLFALRVWLGGVNENL